MNLSTEEEGEEEEDIKLTKIIQDLCARCGRELIIVKVTKELVGNSMVTTTQMSCSDSVCQKRLELNLLKEKEAREMQKSNNYFGYQSKIKT